MLKASKERQIHAAGGVKEKLNTSQEQAVYATGGCLLITAPPGSGKTKVLTERALFLLKRNPTAKLAAVTFTSDAAEELKRRILEGDKTLESRIIAGTFHSLCKQQLHGTIDRLVLVNESQQLDIIKRAVNEANGRQKDSEDEDADSGTEPTLSVNSVKEYIECRKTQINPMFSNSRREQLYEGVYARYEDALAQMGGMDFADLLMRSVKGMKSGAVNPLDVTYMLIDEFQDTDEIQYAWAHEHFKNGVEITVVGDDDQSIYGWRHALGYPGMERFRQRMNASHISLNVSYRCCNEVLTPATTLISRNVERVEKHTQAGNKHSGTAVARGFTDADAEREAIFTAIRLSGKRGGWAVLARNNNILDDFMRILPVDMKNDFLRKGGRDFWEFRGPALFLSICESILYGNMVGIDMLLRKCCVGDMRLKRFHEMYGGNRKGALHEYIAANRGESKDIVANLGHHLGSWKANIDANSEKNIIPALTGIRMFISKYTILNEKDKMGNMNAIDATSLESCVKILASSSKAKLDWKVKEAKTKADNDKKNVVKVMTLHSSKGLEFENVWIMGCEEGIIPSKNSVDIAEERRLIYVGMTRAISNLTLSFRKDKDTNRSRFIDESGILIR